MTKTDEFICRKIDVMLEVKSHEYSSLFGAILLLIASLAIQLSAAYINEGFSYVIFWHSLGFILFKLHVAWCKMSECEYYPDGLTDTLYILITLGIILANAYQITPWDYWEMGIFVWFCVFAVIFLVMVAVTLWLTMSDYTDDVSRLYARKIRDKLVAYKKKITVQKNA